MSLEQSNVNQGNFLFKYRGQLPVILFLFSIPFIKYSASYETTYYFVLFSILFTVFGYLIRFYTVATTPKNTSGRNTNKQIAETLNKTGSYSLVRNPLYLANYFIWSGISLFTFNIYFMIFMSIFFYLIYSKIIKAEELFLKSKFGKEYEIWANTVSSFLPKKINFIKSSIPFSAVSILRREYSSVLSGLIGFIFIDILRNYFENQSFFLSRSITYISFILIFIVLILRTLKHHTNLLNEKDRS